MRLTALSASRNLCTQVETERSDSYAAVKSPKAER